MSPWCVRMVKKVVTDEQVPLYASNMQWTNFKRIELIHRSTHYLIGESSLLCQSERDVGLVVLGSSAVEQHRRNRMELKWDPWLVARYSSSPELVVLVSHHFRPPLAWLAHWRIGSFWKSPLSQTWSDPQFEIKESALLKHLHSADSVPLHCNASKSLNSFRNRAFLNMKLKNPFKSRCIDEWRMLLMMRVDELDRSGCKHHAASASPACLSVGRSPVITGPLLQ